MKGIIVKLTGGLYTVMDETNKLHECKARGKFRHLDISPKVGDNVEFSLDNLTIDEVFERKNSLVRPPVANIDQALLVFSALEPDFNYNLLDRLLTLVTKNKIDSVIIVTKIDLMTENELKTLKTNLSYYESFCKVYYTSSKINENIELVKSILKDKVSVLSGQSGVGKSSLINSIDETFNLKVDNISKALGRGKHTTRHSELHMIAGGMLADTPGFSSLDFLDFELADLASSFTDFYELSSECKFKTCMHINEPACKVKENLEKGKILESRYANYKFFYNEIKNKKQKY